MIYSGDRDIERGKSVKKGGGENKRLKERRRVSVLEIDGRNGRRIRNSERVKI